MAGIDVGGGHGGKRATNHEIPLIPFIDFLLCLVAFLAGDRGLVADGAHQRGRPRPGPAEGRAARGAEEGEAAPRRDAR